MLAVYLYTFDSKYRDEFIHEVLNGVTDLERDLSSEIQKKYRFNIALTQKCTQSCPFLLTFEPLIMRKR